MEKVDWIILTIGVVALTATTLGVIYEPQLAGKESISFVTGEQEANFAYPSDFSDSGATFTVPASMNATQASLDFTVSFTGNAIAPVPPGPGQSASASIIITVTDPNGTAAPSQTKAMPLSNAGGSDVMFTFNLDAFFDVPANVTLEKADLAGFDANKTWMDGYEVAITVDSPGDPFTSGAGPAQASYTYSVSGSVTETFFQHKIDAKVNDAGA